MKWDILAEKWNKFCNKKIVSVLKICAIPLLIICLLLGGFFYFIRDAECQMMVGTFYSLFGNNSNAVKWYRKAAEQGNATGQIALGRSYYYGTGVKQDYAQAVKWYRKAAEQGNAAAQILLGHCYRDGNGVKQDYTKANKWYSKASKDERFPHYFIEYHNNSNLAAIHRDSAENGDVTSQLILADYYMKKQNYTEVIEWYSKAAEQGDAYGQAGLGRCYYEGFGVEKDYAEAVKLFRKSTDQGSAYGQAGLGACYLQGFGVEKDYAEAVKLFRKSADQGNAYGQAGLGACYLNGLGVEKNLVEAEKWLRKAAEQGDSYAKALLQQMEKK